MRFMLSKDALQNPDAAVGEVTTAVVDDEGSEQSVKVLAIQGNEVEVDTNLDAPDY